MLHKSLRLLALNVAFTAAIIAIGHLVRTIFSWASLAVMPAPCLEKTEQTISALDDLYSGWDCSRSQLQACRIAFQNAGGRGRRSSANTALKETGRGSKATRRRSDLGVHFACPGHDAGGRATSWIWHTTPSTSTCRHRRERPPAVHRRISISRCSSTCSLSHPRHRGIAWQPVRALPEYTSRDHRWSVGDDAHSGEPEPRTGLAAAGAVLRGRPHVREAQAAGAAPGKNHFVAVAIANADIGHHQPLPGRSEEGARRPPVERSGGKRSVHRAAHADERADPVAAIVRDTFLAAR